MRIKRFKSEKELIDEFKGSITYHNFQQKITNIKMRREAEAWKLLDENQGKYSIAVLDQVFDLVDYLLEDSIVTWYGLTFLSNRNRIFKPGDNRINEWVDTLLSTRSNYLQVMKALNLCLGGRLKIDGAGTGLASMILYLSNYEKDTKKTDKENVYNIWLPKLQDGLSILDISVTEIKDYDFGKNYRLFNDKVNEFRMRCSEEYDFTFPLPETDFILKWVEDYVKREDGEYAALEDGFNESYKQMGNRRNVSSEWKEYKKHPKKKDYDQHGSMFDSLIAKCPKCQQSGVLVCRACGYCAECGNHINCCMKK